MEVIKRMAEVFSPGPTIDQKEREFSKRVEAYISEPWHTNPVWHRALVDPEAEFARALGRNIVFCSYTVPHKYRTIDVFQIPKDEFARGTHITNDVLKTLRDLRKSNTLLLPDGTPMGDVKSLIIQFDVADVLGVGEMYRATAGPRHVKFLDTTCKGLEIR